MIVARLSGELMNETKRGLLLALVFGVEALLDWAQHRGHALINDSGNVR